MERREKEERGERGMKRGRKQRKFCTNYSGGRRIIKSKLAWATE